MILKCGSKHYYNTKKMWYAHLEEGSSCPTKGGYDRMHGGHAPDCRRKLRIVDDKKEIESQRKSNVFFFE